MSRQEVEAGGYTIRVWPTGYGMVLAMAGHRAPDGTWWPAGVAVARESAAQAVRSAVSEAEVCRMQAKAG